MERLEHDNPIGKASLTVSPCSDGANPPRVVGAGYALPAGAAAALVRPVRVDPGAVAGAPGVGLDEVLAAGEAGVHGVLVAVGTLDGG